MLTRVNHFSCICLSTLLLATSSCEAAPIVTRPKAAKNPLSLSATDTDGGDTPAGTIPITFTLPRASEVTLVINDATGHRVRNLISQTPLSAGTHTIYWNGLNDGEAVPVPHSPGVYTPHPALVPTGSYHVEGLVHDPLDLRYQFTAYPTNLKGVPWPIDLRTGPGGWLADHSAPTDALYLTPDSSGTGKPQVLLVAGVAEASFGLAWVDLDGNKQRGQRRLGGLWTGAEFLARDRGPHAIAGVQAYAGSGWSNDVDKSKGEIRLNLLTANGDQPVLNYEVEAQNVTGSAAKPRSLAQIGGLAVYNGLIVANIKDKGQLLFVSALADAGDVRKIKIRRTPTSPDLGKALGTVALPDAGALAFDTTGHLLVVQGRTVHRYDLDTSGPTPALTKDTILIKSGLEAPQRLAVSDDNTIYISDWGNSQQVKLFSPAGQFLRAIGHAGPIASGTYDPSHMNNPSGMAITPDGGVWVAERNKVPKRISVWNAAGQLVTAYYGPPKYGGGGSLDPRDPSRLYYAEANDAMEFHLDWATGSSRVKSVYWRHDGADEDPLPTGWEGPQNALYANGHQYMTNSYNSNPTRGTSVATLYLMQNDKIRPAVFIGDPDAWSRISDKEVQAALPAELDMDKAERDRRAQGIFVWCDRNGDGKSQPNEFTCLLKGKNESLTSVNFERDLSATVVLRSGTVLRLAPTGTTPARVPLFDAAAFREVAKGNPINVSSGSGGEALTVGNRTVLSGGPIQGLQDGKLQWTYPDQWPSLHAGHDSPRTPQYIGQILASTRVMGWPVHVGQEDLWAINGDKGTVYLLTMDGLFVATLGKYVPDFPQWRMAEAKRNMPVNDVNFSGECFWPTINQAPDGKVYLIVGKEHTSIVSINNLDSLTRLAPQTLNLSAADMTKASAFNQQTVQQATGDMAPLQVSLLKKAPIVDGNLGEWKNLPWASIDDQNQVALAVSGDRLYAAFKSNRDNLLQNAGDDITTLFRSGGALDLMLGPATNPARTKPVIGDLRLIVTQSEGKTLASLSRAVVPGTTKPIEYASPGRTLTLDTVEDVSSQVTLSAKRGLENINKFRQVPMGYFEFSVPLKLLGLTGQAGEQARGDVGILVGQGNETVARIYWHNKASGLVNDVPSEAALTPQLWGDWVVKTPDPTAPAEPTETADPAIP